MKIESWPIDKLIPFHNNSRVHDEKNINAIKASVDRFDWLAPICVDKEGVIIMGHGRREAALQLGMTEVPVLVADWLTENEAAAAREADNMTQDLSFFDMDLLNANLGEIDWLDIDMTEFGFKLDDELSEPESKDISDSLKMSTVIVIDCDSEEQLESAFNKLQSEGYQCRLLTL